MNRIFFILLIVITFLSCKKEHITNNSSNLEIKIKKPTANQIFNSPEEVEFEFEANASSEIHGYEFRILKLPNKEQLKIQNEHVHIKNLQRTYKWSPDTLKGFFQFELKIFPDHEGMFKRDTVNFEVL
ncbi:MAG: hypothetical protein KatS3mg035_0724 [Bacteroidia bacterium]|nr:MAG: hypothetical protein KatS3mg035_0724 [Bacteroidia bacterium]